MTLEEKREACLAELLACLKQILSEETSTLDKAKWHAAAALQTIKTIAKDGRIPEIEETIEWIKQQGGV